MVYSADLKYRRLIFLVAPIDIECPSESLMLSLVYTLQTSLSEQLPLKEQAREQKQDWKRETENGNAKETSRGNSQSEQERKGNG